MRVAGDLPLRAIFVCARLNALCALYARPLCTPVPNLCAEPRAASAVSAPAEGGRKKAERRGEMRLPVDICSARILPLAADSSAVVA